MCDAQAQLFGLGGRGDREATSVLEQVRAGAFNERCSAPIEETVEPGLEAYDIVDLLVGAPDGARYNVAYAGMPRSDAALDAILDQLVAVQAPPAGVVPTVHIQDTMDVDAPSTSTTQLTTDGANGKAVWSPDGERIAFISLRDGQQEIYVMTADGSDPNQSHQRPER